MKTVNSHNSNSYVSTSGVVTVLLFGILAISCNIPVTSRVSAPNPPEAVRENALNLNTANVDELRKLPGIGPKLAAQIVEYRARNGPFSRPEQIILVPGMSDSRFRALRPFVTTN